MIRFVTSCSIALSERSGKPPVLLPQIQTSLSCRKFHFFVRRALAR
jgi:hypothetical protein